MVAGYLGTLGLMNASPAGPATVAATPIRSTFITVLAWLSIIGAAGATLVSLMQAAMYFLPFRDKVAAAPTHWPGTEQMPALAQFFFSHPEIFITAFWFLSVLTFISAVGLLWRKNWARVYFIVVLGLGIVWNLGSLWLQHQVLSVASTTMRSSSPEFTKEAEVFETVFSIVSIAIAVGTAVLFAWLIARLLSRAVRAEFHAP